MVLSIRLCTRRLYTTSCAVLAESRDLQSLGSRKWASIEGTQNVGMLEVNSRLKEMVNMGRLSDARQLFDELPRRDEISWTTLISGYVKASDSSQALSLFSRMWVDDTLRMDPFILSLALKACAVNSNAKHGESLHGYCLKTDFVNSVFVGSALLDMYMKVGKISEGCRVFDDMPMRNVVSWTAIITGLVRAGYNKEGLFYFSDMWRDGVEYDSYTLAIALKACADSGLLIHGKEIHTRALKKGFEMSSFVVNSLATMYNKCGKENYGLCLFERMLRKDVVSWTSIITSYVQTGREQHAIEAFLLMRESEVSPNEYTLAAIISVCANIAKINLGEQLHAHVVHRGLVSSLSVANSIMTLYSKCGKLGLATLVFDEMSVKDIVSWSTIISGYSQGGCAEEAFKFLALMRKQGPQPSEFAFASVLSVCGNMAILEQGMQLHASVLSLGLDHTAMIRSGLINMYSKCGSIQEASRIFNDAKDNDIVSWTAMINGYAEHGLSQEAINLFEEIPSIGLRPDAVTFIGVLSACSHSGLVDLGYHYFNLIKSKYMMNPCKEHYGCMIDLLCRAGRLSEAENMISNMPHSRDDVVWSTLLRACRIHGDVECGKRAANKILELDPTCPVTHTTLANLYSAKGKWREAAEVRKVMRSRGVVKEPGWSWLKVKDQVSTFAAGDKSHPQWEEIYFTLDLLASSTEIFVLDVIL